MRRLLLVLPLLAAAAGLALAAAGAGGPDRAAAAKQAPAAKRADGPTELMRQKLKHSQRVLEGVAVGDFDKIADSGDELAALSKKLEWKVLQTPRYELHTNEFRRAAEGLVEAAKDKNVDAAALAYVDLTMSCVRCHKYVRDVRMAWGATGNGDRLVRAWATGAR